jgi:signal transduction histidine kinase
MNRTSAIVIKTGRGADIAFAIVVFAAYFAIFSAIMNITVVDIVLLVILGISYIVVGIYGYAFCARSGSLQLRLAYFITQILMGSGILYFGQGVGFGAVLLLPLVGHSVILLPQKWMVSVNLLIVAAYITSIMVYVNGWSGLWSLLSIFLAGQVFVAFFTMMAVNEEKARVKVEQMAEELTMANERLRNYALQVEELAVTKERNRLAREIHDGLGHYLTAVHMQIQAADAVMPLDLGKAHAAMEKARHLTQDALDDVRQSVASLRTVPGEGLPLDERVNVLLKNFESLPFQTDLIVAGDVRRLSPQAELTVYRAIQEGLNNACKHGNPTQVCAQLDFTMREIVRVVIEDNGVGTDAPGTGFGLLGLSERIKLLDGRMVVKTKKDHGFRLELEIPG